MHKHAQNFDAAWEIQERYADQPHGWIQWKGTNVCLDYHCVCGFFLFLFLHHRAFPGWKPFPNAHVPPHKRRRPA